MSFLKDLLIFPSFVVLGTIFLFGCGRGGSHLPVEEALQPNSEGTEQVTFGYIEDIEPIFQQRCSLCHPGAAPGNWNDYEEAQSRANTIAQRVSSGNMPPSNITDMTNEERDMVLLWVQEGAPLERGDGPEVAASPEEDLAADGADEEASADDVGETEVADSEESPTPESPVASAPSLPEEGEAEGIQEEQVLSFSENIQPIFENRCSLCHNSAALGDWTDYEEAFSRRDLIAVRVDLDHPDPGPKMPPGNATSMTPEERQMVIDWVEAGAPE